MTVWVRLIWTGAALLAMIVPLWIWQAIANFTGKLNVTHAPRIWYRLASRVLRFRIHKTGQIDTARPLLLVANHVSWTDIIVLGSAFNGAFIAKAEVGDWPIIGPLARLQGTVMVERQRKRSADKQVSALAASLAQGQAMVLFAEGTTSDGTAILPFKSTLFGAARAAIAESGIDQVMIQPVAIAYTRLGGLPMGRRERALASWTGDEELVPHLRRLLTLPPIHVELHFGTPIPFTLDSDRKEVARATEAQVRAMFGEAIAHPVQPRTAAK